MATIGRSAAVCALGTLMILRLRRRIREHARPILARSGAIGTQGGS